MKLVRVSLIAALVSCCFCSCEKDSGRCNCIDSTGEETQVSIDDQECSDLSTPKLKCYPAD